MIVVRVAGGKSPRAVAGIATVILATSAGLIVGVGATKSGAGIATATTAIAATTTTGATPRPAPSWRGS